MKMTNALRAAIVHSIMNDVVSIDYQEKQNQLLVDWAVTQMPEPVKRVWESKELRDYIRLNFFREDCLGANGEEEFIAGGMIPLPDHLHSKVPPSVQHELVVLKKASDEQYKQHEALEQKLRSLLLGCTTTEALLKRAPEFEKYVPVEQEPTKNVPALANLIADLTKAGWPKSRATA